MHSSILLAAIALPLTLAAPARLSSALFPRQQAECSLEGVQQPPSTLPAPAAGLELVVIARGQGTQNYTCGTDKAAAPASFGAVATLFNASCTVSNPVGDIQEEPIGTHFFADSTTPEFDIVGLGNTQAKRKDSANSPDPAANVAWLLLEAQTAGTTSNVKQIYRLNTKGGVAPKTCVDRADGEVITVAYETEYWIYASAPAAE